ncbi:MAG: putative toxin-antitoxin system toxin component, PIN family [Acidobacteria bacterium]|nr:putative toxin-antitoxin system toxin component, PIN family [Acidobacteriota bacterium]
MRAVLDPNVTISGFLSPSGSPARFLLACQRGDFDLVVSPLVLDELVRALGYPKLRRRIAAEEARRIIWWLASAGTVAADPDRPPRIRSVDPGDNYLLALAEAESAVLVSGDNHLLRLAGELPVHSPTGFLALLDQTQP